QDYALRQQLRAEAVDAVPVGADGVGLGRPRQAPPASQATARGPQRRGRRRVAPRSVLADALVSRGPAGRAVDRRDPSRPWRRRPLVADAPTWAGRAAQLGGAGRSRLVRPSILRV